MKSQILIGASEFMTALSARAQEAKESLYVQAMTFEGDAAGEELIHLMLQSPARDKRLIIDSFSKAVVSDHFVFGLKYLRDPNFKGEVKNTYRLLAKAEANGIKVKFVNPTGPLMLRYPLRNHKKMMVVDGRYSYLGGINFSDHNFEWHDMMLEMEDLSIGKAIRADFLTTWNGSNQSLKENLKGHQLFFLNGVRSKSLYEEFFDILRQAQSKITVISPYVSEPLLPELQSIAESGVEVSIISPKENNKGLFFDFLLSQSKKGFFKLFHHPGMFHLKAILIDSDKLVFGSSNYDLISYHFEQEVVMITEDRAIVNEFANRVLDPMTKASVEYQPGAVKATKAKAIMKGLKVFCQLTSNTILKPKS